MENNDTNLIEIAKDMLDFAYAPYSKFKVGSALLTSSGKIYSGCNIENLSFSLTNCAERTAIFSSIANGDKQFVKIVVTTEDNHFTPPCGACLQVMSEFVDPEFEVILVKAKSEEKKKFQFKELLPNRFDPDRTIGE